MLLSTVRPYLSRGGSLREREAGMISAPLAAVTPAGGWVPSGGPVLAFALEGGAWDLERRSLLSRGASPPPVGSFKAAPRLAGRTPCPENHSPDLVRISCCLRHRLHTHITCGIEGRNGLGKLYTVLRERNIDYNSNSSGYACLCLNIWTNLSSCSH